MGGQSSVEVVGARLYLRMSGLPTAEAVGVSASAASAADAEGTSTAMVMDCMELGPGDLSPEDFHTAMRAFHTNFSRPHEYRIAVAGSPAFLDSVARPYVEARDVLMPVPRTSLPELRLFGSIAEAEAWLDGEGAA